MLCASPQFLARHPPPKQLSDLAALPCLVIKERDHPFGIWQLHSKEGQHAIKVTGPLSSNHGEIVHQWCLDGQGIALRSWWDVRGEYRQRPSLVHVLPEFFQPANVWAVYVSRLATSAKIRTTVEFLRHYFQQHYPQHEPTASAVGRGRLNPKAVAQAVVGGAHGGKRNAQAAAARERVVRQFGEGVEPLGVAAQQHSEIKRPARWVQVTPWPL